MKKLNRIFRLSIEIVRSFLLLFSTVRQAGLQNFTSVGIERDGFFLLSSKFWQISTQNDGDNTDQSKLLAISLEHDMEITQSNQTKQLQVLTDSIIVGYRGDDRYSTHII